MVTAQHTLTDQPTAEARRRPIGDDPLQHLCSRLHPIAVSDGRGQGSSHLPSHHVSKWGVLERSPVIRPTQSLQRAHTICVVRTTKSAPRRPPASERLTLEQGFRLRNQGAKSPTRVNCPELTKKHGPKYMLHATNVSVTIPKVL